MNPRPGRPAAARPRGRLARALDEQTPFFVPTVVLLLLALLGGSLA